MQYPSCCVRILKLHAPAVQRDLSCQYAELVPAVQDHYSAVTSLSLVPEGNLLLTAGRDKVAILWDVHTHKKLATIPVFEAIEGERCTCQPQPRSYCKRCS